MGRDLRQCMHMIALWLWLEEVGYPNIILKMLTLPDWVVNVIADEAVRCLNCIQSKTPPPYSSSTITTEIPVTEALMEDKQISLSSFLYPNRQSALRRTTNTVNNVCFRATFEDIVQQAALANNNNDHTHDHDHDHDHDHQQQEGVSDQLINLAVQGIANQPMTSSSTGGSVVQQELVEVSVGPVSQPHAAAAGVVVQERIITPGSSSSVLETGDSSSQTSVLISNDNHKVPRGKRSMFMTFSRGHPITGRALRNFFVRSYGECIEDLYMQEVPPNRQSLYARVVFRSIRTVAAILDGKDKAKFAINGKHVWARLYVEKEKQNQSAEVPQAPAADT
ncbi:hypothetical protein BVC80_1835g578 [Macleaya cordata]|uniref:Uncharacterized protein n=1 Tax=Macleaya cordata TaxID=56857 RepID=A0A200R612_MACCD|nr:hypothetical protein BVC80_1835g578 [Macleaya cordata]